ncbi:hypothetical protein Pint_20240 [Pistacia integerrima]|uniref:Uncharacterized protein n=1 Tax=Pistacia integerrima TaxID=434235 RepID=A0ACC0X9J2_9ROSI|nr:hypothetical protein Pint_20240 [Pistacia integerrima]
MHVIVLCTTMLLVYYGYLKSKAYLIMGINGIGSLIKIIYLIFYLMYASRKENKFTPKLILLLNVGASGGMILISNFLLKGSKRVTAVGWLCAAYNLAAIGSPLSIMKRVITTKSVRVYAIFFVIFPYSQRHHVVVL